MELVRPWLWAIGLMRGISEMPGWRPVMADPGPGVWLKKWQTQGRVGGYEAG
jgi:hypothetical protein